MYESLEPFYSNLPLGSCPSPFRGTPDPRALGLFARVFKYPICEAFGPKYHEEYGSLEPETSNIGYLDPLGKPGPGLVAISRGFQCHFIYC